MAGTLYKFILVLDHHQDNPSTCQVASTSPETCTMVVYDVPWQQKKTVEWDQVDCAGTRVEVSAMGHQADPTGAGARHKVPAISLCLGLLWPYITKHV